MTVAAETLTDRESGVERVRDLLKAAKRGEVRLHACFVTLTDFIAATALRVGAVLVHKDPELAALGRLVPQELLPLKGVRGLTS